MRSLAVIACLLAGTPALAANWQVNPGKSRLSFEAEQAGEKLAGGFSAFTATIDFDPSAPEKGKITVTVDMASATIDGKDRQESLPTSDWFAVKQFPTATFTSTSIRAAGNDMPSTKRFIASGSLSIKGVAKDVELPFTLTSPNGAQGAVVAAGEIMLNRKDFSVGTGQWESDAYVKYPVRVRFEVHASQR